VSASAEPLGPHLKRLLSVVVLGSFLSVLDMTVVNVAIDRLGERLHSPLTTVQWVITGYTLALAASVPMTGWLARRMGAKRLYVATLVGFTVASGLCGIAWSAESLIVFRVLQGAFGGMLLPLGQVIMAREAGPQKIRRAMAVAGSAAVVAPIIGPVLGGLVVGSLSWRWAFLVNLPVGVVGTALAVRLLPRDEGGDAGPIDWLGLLLVGSGLPLLTYGVTSIGEGKDVWSLGAAPAAIVGVLAVVAFVLNGVRIPNPLLELRLYRNRTFSVAAGLSTLLGAAVFGPYLLLPLLYQDVRGATPLQAGLLFAPQGVGAAAAIYLVGRIGTHISGGQIAIIGTTLMTLFTVPFAFIHAHTPLAPMLVALALRGFGIGLSMIPAVSSALAVLDRDDMAHASPQLNVLQRVGASIATAVFAVILASQAAGAGAYRHTFVWVVAACAACIPLAAWLRRLERPATAPEAELAAAEAT
jgi:EmrB/QacA subfamily drug resistance transporter